MLEEYRNYFAGVAMFCLAFGYWCEQRYIDIMVDKWLSEGE